MRGLKLLFKGWASFCSMLWITVGMTVVCAALPFIFNEPFGGDDYLFPKIMLGYSSVIATSMGLISTTQILSMNKFIRACPIAKELFTRSLPLFILILSVGWSAVSCGAYSIFLAITGAPVECYSDMLMCSAILCGPTLFAAPLFGLIPGGGMFGMYFSIIPIIIIVVFNKPVITKSGFGLPLGTAALIYAAVMAVGAAWVIFRCSYSFKRSNVKIYNTGIYYETKFDR